MPSAKSLLLRLANDICREHGKALNQKITVAAFLGSGKQHSQKGAWMWLAEEYRRRSGVVIGLTGAMKKAGNRPRVVSVRSKKERASPISPNFTQSPEWRRLRFTVLRASNGCCTLCGRSQRQHGVVLHVDHIKPKSKFPHLALVESNLQVLCEDCNIGKGNRDDTDWR